jgi:uncharacterized protein (DUF1778 family)
MKTTSKARFDTRLRQEQKEFFEYAARLGGFRTLTEFVVFSAQKRAEEIVEEHNKILASKRDREIFFNALTNPPHPNKYLKKAASRYNQAISK